VSKRLELLRDLVPNAAVVGVLVNQQSGTAEEQIASLQGAAGSLGLRALLLDGRDIDAVFAEVARQHIDALFVTASAYFYSIRDELAARAARHRIPVIYESREFPEAGGLISYGVDFADVYRQLGDYAGKILRGAKPADLPVLQPTKFELVINLKTAKSLGLAVPPNLLALADEVLE
jgi:putative ABC transport system substrate-binding protein